MVAILSDSRNIISSHTTDNDYNVFGVAQVQYEFPYQHHRDQ